MNNIKVFYDDKYKQIIGAPEELIGTPEEHLATFYPQYKDTARYIDIGELIDINSEDEIDQINRFLNLLRFHTEYEGQTEDKRYIKIFVSGDWKHEHLCLKYLMEKVFGLERAWEDIEEETGGDWYKAVHYYRRPEPEMKGPVTLQTV